MISREVALRFTSKHYPEGPEKLAEKLEVEVHASPLRGVEGWCVRGANTTVRVNSNSSKSRQRFTLAQELAHLVLGTEPDIATEPFHSDTREERDADQLASEFLIPQAQLEVHFRGKVPIDAKSLKRLAKNARVSPVMASCRVVNSAVDLGLCNASVLFFKDGIEQWCFSPSLQFAVGETDKLIKKASHCFPEVLRVENGDGNVLVASMIDTPDYQILLVQLLQSEQAKFETSEERIRTLADELFEGDEKFRPSIAGRLGICKAKCDGMSLADAVEFFYSQYVGSKYTGERASRLRTAAGREYIRLYLVRWFPGP